MEQKLVSVVLPIYNVEPFLNRAVESVVAQTYSNIEIILVDDGSPDNCGAICDEWAKKDSRIRVVHKENAGLGMARNSGIEAATGDYIFFFDSDDYVEPTVVEECVALAAEHGAQSVLYGYDRRDVNNNKVYDKVPELYAPVLRGEEVRNIVIPCMAGPMVKDGKNYHVMVSACGSMYDMNIIRKTGVRFMSERQLISEDLYWNLEYYQYVDCVAVLPKPYYHYCTANTTSLTKKYDPRRFERLIEFYQAATELCDRLGYVEQTKVNVSSQVLSSIMKAIKQLVCSDKPFGEKLSMLKDMLHNEDFVRVLATYDSNLDTNTMRKMFTHAMKKKQVLLTYLLVWSKEHLRK